MKTPYQGHLFAVPAFMVLLVAICNLLDAQTQSKPTPPNEFDEYPRSKEGNIIVEVVDLLYAAQDAELQAAIKGQTIEIIGQWMSDKSSNANGNRFKLVRMFLVEEGHTRPVGVFVESAAKPKGAEKSWIKVVGTVEFPVEGGKTIAVVKATKIEGIDPPKETMLY